MPDKLCAVKAKKSCPAAQAILYQVNCTILRLPGLFISLFFLAVPLLPRVGLCRNLHYIMFQSSNVVRLGNVTRTPALLA